MSDFDFDAFIEQIVPTRVTVELSTVDHSKEIDDLERMLADLPDEDEITDKRAAQKSPRTQITQRIDALRAEEDAAPGMQFTLRPLTPDELKSIYDDEGDTRYQQIAWQCVEPKLTPEQWATLAERLESPRFARIMQAAADLTMREAKSPAFSQSASAGRRSSSKN